MEPYMLALLVLFTTQACAEENPQTPGAAAMNNQRLQVLIKGVTDKVAGRPDQYPRNPANTA